MVELRKITAENLNACLKLEVADGQDEFVASNSYTLAEAYVALVNGEFIPMPYAIYEGDTMVGFIGMAKTPPASGTEIGYYEMYRFMIDKHYQGRGLGRAALAQAIELLETQPLGQGTHIATSFVPGNDVAKRLYASLGFVETGELDDDELVMRYELH